MFQISFYILIVVLSLMAVLMLAVPYERHDKRLYGYRVSRWMLAVSYLALAIYCFFKGRLQLEFISPIFLFMSNLQAGLLALSHVNLLNPKRVTKKYVAWHFLPMTICLLMYIVVRCFAPHVPLTTYGALAENILEPDVIVRVLWMAEYIAFYVYIICLFHREYQRWRSIAADFFADDKYINLYMIHANLLVAIGIGAVTFGITSSLNPTVSALLNLLIMLLYIIMGIIFLQYPPMFMKMKPVLYDDSVSLDDVLKVDRQSERWQNIKEQIINKQLYLQRGITLERTAHMVGVSRTILSNTLNREEGMNFNAFINRLRILESQRLMREEPSISLYEIAEMVGYTEQSNFSRHFKRWSGMTPAEWKKREP